MTSSSVVIELPLFHTQILHDGNQHQGIEVFKKNDLVAQGLANIDFRNIFLIESGPNLSI